MESRIWQVGRVKITTIVEIEAGDVIQRVIPDATKENVLKIPWLQSHYADRDGNLKAVVQTFLIETPTARMIVDTCTGNHKQLKDIPEWANLKTDFLERLEKTVPRDRIDTVLCTHLHFDHVGWNTVAVDGRWEPTFPSARYYFTEKEFEYWKSEPALELADDRQGFQEAVLPIVKAGRAELVQSDYQISEEVSFIPTPGHTPGHVSILIRSEGKEAIITGDAIHHPCQIAHPGWRAFDTDSDTALASRRALLERVADTDTLLIGTHFANPAAGYVHRVGSSFTFIV